VVVRQLELWDNQAPYACKRLTGLARRGSAQTMEDVRSAPSRRRCASDDQPAKGCGVSSCGRWSNSTVRPSNFAHIVLVLVVTMAKYVRRILAAFRVLRSLGSRSNNREKGTQTTETDTIYVSVFRQPKTAAISN
jgi:hypothetical protein